MCWWEWVGIGEEWIISKVFQCKVGTSYRTGFKLTLKFLRQEGANFSLVRKAHTCDHNSLKLRQEDHPKVKFRTLWDCASKPTNNNTLKKVPFAYISRDRKYQRKRVVYVLILWGQYSSILSWFMMVEFQNILTLTYMKMDMAIHRRYLWTLVKN